MNKIKHRKQNRLKGFDYSSNGYYYVTICTKNREKYFGEIIDNKMVLNKYGEIVKTCWFEIPKHFNNVKLDKFQMMPNHLHGIIVIVGAGFSRPINLDYPTLGQIIGYFKYQSTKYINDCIVKGSEDPTPTEKHKYTQIFQRSFYDIIIRSEMSLYFICQYIRDNPKNWETDRNNLK
jgi:putative transposase